MLENPAEALQRGVWAGPRFKGWFNRRDDLLQDCKITVVNAATPGEFPDPFDRIEFRTVGRQKVQAKVTGDFPPPWLMELGMVITGIVDDDHHFPAWPTVSLQFSKEVPAGDSVKPAVGPGHDQLAVLEAHGAKKAD